MQRKDFFSAGAIVVAVWTGGCTDQVTAPLPQATASAAEASATELDRGLASLEWQATARGLVTTYKIGPNPGARMYALVSVAQYAAVVAADEADGPVQRPLRRGAIAGASAVMLAYLFPLEVAFLDGLVSAETGALGEPARQRFVRGDAIGRTIGAQMVERAKTDGFNAIFTGTIPAGPGFWISSAAPPVSPLLSSALPYFLESGSQFRPDPPPAFGSEEFLAALNEVREISDTRTPEQLSIAQYWGSNPVTTLGQWNIQAEELINGARFNERQAAHALALTDAAVWDASIACFDAKYAYWFLRPSHADPAITLPIGLPNHPSYPSAHSCISAAAAEVLGKLFPESAEELQAMVVEAGRSRVYAGIHYQFDIHAGQVLGRRVARFAIQVARKRGLLSGIP